METVKTSPEEHQVNILACALEFQFGAEKLVGDAERVTKVVEQVLSNSRTRSPSKAVWEQAVRTNCEVDEDRKRNWPDHQELNVLLIQLLRVLG